MSKRHIVALVMGVVLAIAGLVGLSTMSASAGEHATGTSANDPIWVDSPNDVPSGAVKTGSTKTDCATTTTWTLTVPATTGTSHQEFRYDRIVPGQQEVSHMEYKYQRTVVDYKTQYHFRKFTHTKTRTPAGPDLWWNWSPNNTQGPQDYVPDFPTDDRGTWQGPHQNGGPMQNTYGTFQTGGGNSPWFHREHGTPAGDWSDYGPWTPWEPMTHESWQDSPDPLGVPQYHGSGTYPDGTEWYREWQAQWDGQTRQVENGSHVETTDWLTEPPEGDGWEQIDSRKVIDQEATDPYTEYFVLGGDPSLNEADASWVLPEQVPADQGWEQFDERTVQDTEGTPEVKTYYAYNDGVECASPTPPKKQAPPVRKSVPGVPTVIDAGL